MADDPALLSDVDTPPVGVTADDTEAVRRDLLGVLFRNTPTIAAGNLAVALVTTLVFVSAGVGDFVLVWLGVLSVLIALRVFYVRRVCRSGDMPSGAHLRRCEYRYAVIAGLTGLTWGALPWLVFFGRDPFLDFFSVAMLVGMTGGAVTATTPLPRALNAYLVAALLPFVVKAYLTGGVVYLGGGTTVFFYLLVMLSFGRSSHAAMRDALLLKRQNARLADRLRRERDAVQAAMRAKNLFLAGVTHDLRQPTQAIGLHIAYLKSLQREELDFGQLQQMCADIDMAVRGMNRHLSRLMELSRLEAGEARLDAQWVDVEAVFEQCAAQFGPMAREKGLALRFYCRALQVWADAVMLQSVMDNLVSNAIRYTDAGRVLVTARPQAGYAQLCVWDSGRGIEPSRQAQVFVAYQRFDDPARDDGEGQGLGLALVKRQAELLGSCVALRSTPGRGSMFGIRLPARSVPSEGGHVTGRP